MTWFWVTVAFIVLSWGLEYYLSYRENKWYGLILPIALFAATGVFLVLNLLHVFPAMEVFGSFLVEHGFVGLLVVVLKAGFLFTPTAVHLIIYFVCKHRYQSTHNPVKHNKEYKKMLADDL